MTNIALNVKKIIFSTSPNFHIIVFLFICISNKLLADDIGIATGLNISTYKSWNSESTKFQKIDYFNPIEVYYQKNIFKSFGLRSSLSYKKLSLSTSLTRTIITPSGSIEEDGIITSENINNYVSIELSPIFSYSPKKMVFVLRTGLSTDIYINESYDNFGNKSELIRNKDKRSLLLSFVIGVGMGYNLTEKIKIGISSSILRTMTDIIKNQNKNIEIYYVNYKNVICICYTF